MRSGRLTSQRRGVAVVAAGPGYRIEASEARTLMSVGFQAPNYLASDFAPAEAVTLVRGSSFGSEKVEFRTADGTATPGVDYTPVDQTVVFQDGESTKTVLVPLLSDPANTGERSVTLTLEEGGVPATGGYGPDQAVLSIVHRLDITPPTVLHSYWQGKNNQLKSITITFSEPMDLAAVQDVSNYAVRNNKMDLKPARNGSDPAVVAIRSAVYDPSTNTVTLTPAGRVTTSKNGFWISTPTPSSPNLAVSPPPSRLVDRAGNRLSSASNGIPDGNFSSYAIKDPNNNKPVGGHHKKR